MTLSFESNIISKTTICHINLPLVWLHGLMVMYGLLSQELDISQYFESLTNHCATLARSLLICLGLKHTSATQRTTLCHL